jgi:hypothetical protein
MKIRPRPTLGAMPLECSSNVAKRIAHDGGKAVFGWAVKDCGFYTAKQNHCIWEDPDGTLWDVTPQPIKVEGRNVTCEFQEVEFERDDTATFANKSAPTRFISKIDDPKVKKGLGWFELSEKRLKDGDLEACRYYTNKANANIGKALPRFRGWESPASLDTAEWLKLCVN